MSFFGDVVNFIFGPPDPRAATGARDAAREVLRATTRAEVQAQLARIDAMIGRKVPDPQDRVVLVAAVHALVAVLSQGRFGSRAGGPAGGA